MTLLLILPVVLILGDPGRQGRPAISDRLPLHRSDQRDDGGRDSSRPSSGPCGSSSWPCWPRSRRRGGGALPERIRTGQLADADHQPGHHQSRRCAVDRSRALRGRRVRLFFRFGTSILAASLTLAVMTLPVVIVATRESLQAVPQAFREACWNMGATRWQTIRHGWFSPIPISGILTGVILEVSRTAGETAPIMFTGAAFFLPFLPQSVFDQTMAMSLPSLRRRDPGAGRARDHLPFGVALVLISMVLLDECRLDRASAWYSQETEEMVGANASESPAERREKLTVRNLSIRYGGKPAIEGIDLSVREHEIFGDHRARQQRQDLVPACTQPDGSFHRRPCRSMARSSSTVATSGSGATSTRCGARSASSFRCRWACR